MDAMSIVGAGVGAGLRFANHLKRVFSSPSEIDQMKGELDQVRQRLDAHEKRIAFLEIFREVNVQAVQRIHDLQGLQENQKIKLRNLEEKIENLMFLFETLEKLNPDQNEQDEILSLQRSLRNQLGRARSRVAV